MSDQIIIFVPGNAVPFARSGANGKQRFTPAKQRAAMDTLGLYANRAMEGRPPLTGPVHMQLRATYPYPSSWSQKKRDATIWKTSKPDADNLAKLAADALNKIVFVDDAQVAFSEQQKKYGPVASLVITVTPLEEGV